MKNSQSFLLGTLLLFFSFSLIIAQDGKMAITSSSEKALELYYQALKFQNNFQPLKAQPLFEEALKQDSKFAMAQFGLAGTYGQPRLRQEAFAKLFEILKTANLSEGEKIFFDGLSAGFNNDQATRTKKVFELAEKFPKDERALSAVAAYYNGQGESKKALDAYENILRINPNYLPVYNSLGYIYRAEGRMEDAERTFKKAISLNKENPNAYDSYAELLLKLGRYDESIENYEMSLKIDPIFPSAVMGIASNLIHKGRHSEAIKRLEAIHKIAPNDNIRGGVSWAMSAVHIDEGDFENALEAMHRNLYYSKKQNDNASMGNDYSNIARIYRLKKDYTNARKYTNLAMESYIKTNNSEAQNINTRNNFKFSFISIAILSGDLDLAKKELVEYKAYIDTQKNNRFLVFNLHELYSMIAFAEKDYEKVLDELKSARQWSYTNMYRKALSYEALSRDKEAKEIFELIASSRGALNYEYSVYRHVALKKIVAL